MTRSPGNVGSGGSGSGSSMNLMLRTALPTQLRRAGDGPVHDSVHGTARKRAGPVGRSETPGPDPGHSTRLAHLPETNRAARNLRRSAHNPETYPCQIRARSGGHEGSFAVTRGQ